MSLPPMPEPERAPIAGSALGQERQQELYEALLQAQSDLGEGVLILAGTEVLYANEALTQLFGYRPEELMAGKFRQAIAPHDLAMLESRRGMREARADRSDRYELSVTHRDGRRVHLEVAAKTVCLQGRSVSVLLIRDLTERMRLHEQMSENERRFRQLVEATFEGIALTEDGIIVAVNPAFVRMFGYEAQELVGEAPHHLIAPEARQEVMHRIHAADDRPYEVLCRRKDGSTFVASVQPGSHHFQGRVVRVTAVRDVTEQRAVESLKDEFVSVVSHELRTPLTSIRGALGLLASGKLGALPSMAEHLVAIAANNADRLVRLVNDILDIERMRSGKCSLKPVEVPVEELLLHAVDVVRQLADRAQVRLEVLPVPGTVRVDADRFNQLLTNLLSNAIKFSPSGGAIRLQAEARGREWRFTVTDQGRGIPHDQLESIFGRFQQVDASDARQKGGSGLGLAICRSIAEQHGGRIWAESTLGQGSTFIVTLPESPPRGAEEA